ncbi:hypothetical protein V8F33_011226 [Rhypophila sp. PSN 637]
MSFMMNQFSTINDSSGHSDPNTKPGENSKSLPGEMFMKVLKVIDDGTKDVEGQLELAETHIRIMISHLNGQGSHTTLQKELRDLELKARDLRAQRVVRLTHRCAMAGAVLDRYTGDEDWEDVDEHIFINHWAYIDVLVDRYKKPTNGTIDIFRAGEKTQQDQFRKRCVISGKEDVEKIGELRAAHLVPYNIGETTATYLFGKAENKQHGRIMSEANALPLHTQLEEALDNGQITIVPATKENEWKVVVLDHIFAQNYKEAYHIELDQKVLTFQGDFRPKSRYLYFAHIITILRRQRYEVPGWWKDASDSGSTTRAWAASPGEHVKKGPLMVLAQRMGHIPKNEAATMLGATDEEMIEADEGMAGKASVISDIVSLSSRSPKTPTKIPTLFSQLKVSGSSEDDDSDDRKADEDEDSGDDKGAKGGNEHESEEHESDEE